MGFDLGSLANSVIGNVIDIGKQYWSADFNSDEATQAREFNRDEASTARGWQEQMRGTQYQTAVKDMQAAGLNPMLAYHMGGAGTPSGATASSSPAMAASPGHSSAAAMQTASQIRLNEAAADKVEAETARVEDERNLLRAQTGATNVSAQKMGQEIKESLERMEKIRQDVITGQFTAFNIDQQTKNLREVIPQIQAHVRNLDALTKRTAAETGLTEAQHNEAKQRIAQNLPELERAIKDLDRQARLMQQPGLQQDASVKQGFIGSLGSVIRALSPLNSITNIIGR